MAHKHLCLNCDTVLAQGDFDCEIDADHDFAQCVPCAKGIDVRFTEAGHYWLNGPANAQIDLGECASDGDLRDAIAEAVNAGSGDEDWSDWIATL